MKNFPGTFIVLEGIDGCGKGTQARMLKQYFESRGREVVSRHEPTYESEPSLKIREILQHKEKASLLDQFSTAETSTDFSSIIEMMSKRDSITEAITSGLSTVSGTVKSITTYVEEGNTHYQIKLAAEIRGMNSVIYDIPIYVSKELPTLTVGEHVALWHEEQNRKIINVIKFAKK